MFTCVQVGRDSVIDYIASDQSLYNRCKNFQIWEEEFSIVSDHRILTIEIEGSLDRSFDSDRNNEKQAGKSGWKRD